MTDVIDEYFKIRKEAWLKKNIKASMTEIEVAEKEQQCEQIFALAAWLPNAAKRAGQIAISTHPCTFSHPSARKNKNGYVSAVIAKNQPEVDGFLRTGNVRAEPDALGNAAALDVYKFLTLEMEDGQTLLAHIEQETALAKALLEKSNMDYQQIRTDFLQMIASDAQTVTSSKIKQVYFPIDDGYHLLSVLTNSGILYALRKKIDNLRFSEQTKQLRVLKKENKFSEVGYQEIYGLTTIGYGGTKPQNISVLNNQNAGKAHLLSSLPPTLTTKFARFPKKNFFIESINPWHYQQILQALHHIFITDYNNHIIREGRDYRVQEFIDAIIAKAWQLRIAIANSDMAPSQTLAEHQQIWLYPEREKERLENDEWLMTIQDELCRCFFRCYQKVLGTKAVKHDDAFFNKVAQIVSNSMEGL